MKKYRDVAEWGLFVMFFLVYHLMIDSLVVCLSRFAKHGVSGHYIYPLR